MEDFKCVDSLTSPWLVLFILIPVILKLILVALLKYTTIRATVLLPAVQTTTAMAKSERGIATEKDASGIRSSFAH